MTIEFYKCLKGCNDTLDKMYPKRNWPSGAMKTPRPHIVEIIKMRRRGFTNAEIAATIRKPRKVVSSTIRKAGCQ
jgi:hypothetical protein|tara:strand:- start:764 stop:988 length:225 start_codon:yes stop_codon:yes gene_type:complete